MNASEREITVAICTHNRPDCLGRALDSLVEQSLPRNRFGILIVENCCADATDELIRKFHRPAGLRLDVVSEPRLGLGNARNRALASAASRYLAFLDDDARAAPDWLERILAAFEDTRPSPAIVGGPCEPQWERAPPVWYPRRRDEFWGGDVPHFATGYDIAGCNFAIDREQIPRRFQFDTSLGVIGKRPGRGEDTAFFVRCEASGLRLWYDPRVRVVDHWVPVARMTLRYQMRRAYDSGYALSRIQGNRVLSRATLRGAWVSLRHGMRGSVVRPGPDRYRESAARPVLTVEPGKRVPLSARFAEASILAAKITGWLSGARW